MTDFHAGRGLVLEAARAFDAGSDRKVGPSTAKYFCSEMVGRVADRAVQIHGGAGYMRGVAVERFFRDARLFRIYEGTSQIQQVIIARARDRCGGRRLRRASSLRTGVVSARVALEAEDLLNLLEARPTLMRWTPFRRWTSPNPSSAGACER